MIHGPTVTFPKGRKAWEGALALLGELNQPSRHVIHHHKPTSFISLVLAVVAREITGVSGTRLLVWTQSTFLCREIKLWPLHQWPFSMLAHRLAWGTVTSQSASSLEGVTTSQGCIALPMQRVPPSPAAACWLCQVVRLILPRHWLTVILRLSSL